MRETEIADYGPLPSKAQMQYHREELAAFIHFGMNTYYDREWEMGKKILIISIQSIWIPINGSKP